MFRGAQKGGKGCTTTAPTTSSTSATSAATLIGLEITATDAHRGAGPSSITDESFQLVIPDGSVSAMATLAARSYVGVLRGLETFSQMLMPKQMPDGTRSVTTFEIARTPWKVAEAPRFGHRGVLLDPARTFLPLRELESIVDGM
jgi:hexosaminidase